MMLGATLSFVQVLFGLLGIFLVTREVYRGYLIDEVELEHPFLKQAQLLYTAEDYRTFFLACRLDEGDTPEAARVMVRHLEHEDLREAAETMWGQQAGALAKVLDRYQRYKRPKAVRRRRRDLFLGAGCLMLATLMGLWG